MDMRCVNLLMVGLLVIGVTTSSAHAQAINGEHEQNLLPDPREMARVEAAVDRALEYLLQHQRGDGSWPSGFGDNNVGSNNGVNALCLLAFLGRGHEPGRGPYQHVIDRAINYLLATQRDDGLYHSPNTSHGPMYEHGLATLAMIEAYGFVPSPEMRRSVQSAVALIVNSQNDQGGWRYHPRPNDADLTVSVVQIVALRAAINARLDVPDETFEKAQGYVKSCIIDGGGYAYQPGRNDRSLARAGGGSLSMQLMGLYDHESVDATLAWMTDQKYGTNIARFWYSNYYAMQAAYQAGGAYWNQWHPQVRQFLLENQHANGSWEGYNENNHNGNDARCYSTALGALTLEVYMHYLPAYQR
ncbi:MAG: prenyltransferase/squalene oxidase repeat-containing protein [Phycisphaeraceae bacterium]